MRIWSYFLVAGLAVSSTALYAEMPDAARIEEASEASPHAEIRFTFEGQLRSPDGRPLEGNHRLWLSLFRGGSGTAADSGTLLYGETVEVTAQRGRVVHAVGTGVPTFGSLTSEALLQAGQTADPGQVLWLQVAVGDHQRPLLPRTRLNAVPFAATAGDASRLGGAPAETFVRVDDLAAAVGALAADLSRTVKAAGTGYLSFIGGGSSQDASGGVSAIGGGTNNHATWWAAFIGGGEFNWATGTWSAVAGGLANAAIANKSFVGGGSENRAEGENSAVVGGEKNTAAGAWSFAGGRRAKATGAGTFLWADSEDADFTVPGEDKFGIRARNGAGIIANGTLPALTINNYSSGHGVSATTNGGIGGNFVSSNGIGVRGSNSGNSPGGDFSSGGNGVLGTSSGLGTYGGVKGVATSAAGNGVIGEANGGLNAYGIYGISTSGYAGYFTGKVQINGNCAIAGTLSKSSGTFKIDHPLDPENKYLYHSFVESPDMMNVYNGNATLDEAGQAVVELPAYFEALNRDFRYQLTPIGAPAVLYVAEKIANNRFRIAGGEPGMEVSWQVTGVRKDAYAVAHPVVVEQEKPADERGTLLHPAEHGAPAEKGVEVRRSARKQAASGR